MKIKLNMQLSENIQNLIGDEKVVEVKQITPIFKQVSLDKIYTLNGKFIAGCIVCQESDYEVLDV